MRQRLGEALVVVALVAAAELLRAVPFAQTATFDPGELAIRALFLLALWWLAHRLHDSRLAVSYVVAIAAFAPAILDRTSAGPLEIVLASVPALAIDGADVRVVAWGEPMRATYLGLLALPLAAVGVVAGRRRVGLPLLGLLGIGAAATLAGVGGVASLALLLAAGLGFETLEERRDLMRRALLVAPIWFVATLVYYGTLGPPPALLGFATLCAVGFAILLAWASRLPQRSRRGPLTGVVVLALLDVATVTFWHSRAL